MDQEVGFQNGNNLNIISYSTFIDKIIETRKYDYDCRILLFFTGDLIMYENIFIEDEDNFDKTFSNLIYFIETEGCENKLNFKQIIDDLIEVIDKKELTAFHIDYILSKNDILKIINKYHEKKINLQVLQQQLYKYFKIDNFDEVKYLLKNEFQVEIFL